MYNPIVRKLILNGASIGQVVTGRTSKNSKKTEVGKSVSASAAKKKGANGAKVSKYNENPKC